MAVQLKSRQQIAHIREAGRKVAELYAALREYIVPGISTAELDRIAAELMRRKGVVSACKNYGALRAKKDQPARPAFPGSICTSINDVICHGIPNFVQRLCEGDIISIDICLFYKGWCGDSCVTFAVGAIDPETQRLLEVTKRCLALGIEQARPGNYIGDIGAAIQTYAEAQGFTVVQELAGHGVGRSMHEDPPVLHFGSAGSGLQLRPGMVFTVEPMVNAGQREVYLLPDQWTIRTADGSRSAQFEHTIAITYGKPELLTLP